ncbi:hypothetical protein MLL77_08785 [Aeromonas caviae]|nr:hypothetical protein MLL77_08785 [Aeromonas caviae]
MACGSFGIACLTP